MSSRPHVTSIIVTYRDRYKLCAKVVLGCLNEGMDRVIVIDNGSTPEVSFALDSELTHDPRVVIIRLPSNLGPAGGFKAGIKEATANLNTEFLWFLDDDTVPENGSLQELLNAACSFGMPKKLCVLYSYRPRWADDKKAISTGKGKTFPSNAYCGFTLTEFFAARIKRRAYQHSSFDRGEYDFIKTEMGPYGGLFSHLKTFEIVGLPNQEFFCYFDDHELSARINRAGIDQFIVSRSVLDEIDFTLTAGKGLFEVKSDFTVFLKVRNQIHLYKKLKTSRVRYNLNKLGFYSLFIAPQIFKGALISKVPFWKRLLLIYAAISDGEKGRLGVPPHLRT